MSGADDSSGEKSFEPTEKKLSDARRQGDVAKSTDVSAAAAYLGLLLALFAAGAAPVEITGGALARFLGRADQLEGRILGPGGAGLAGALIGEAMLGLLPLLALPALAAFIALLAQRAFAFSPEKLQPKLSRIDPVSVAGNKFGPTGLMDFLRNLVKMCAIGVVLWLYLASESDRIIGVMRAPARMLPGELVRLGTGLLTAITAIAVVIAALDLLWQRFNHARRLRMSLKEMRDEAKESEGDPHQKAARRRRGEEIARNQMLADVPKADVVITNPSHYAVALKWSRKPGAAPECVAKGVDETARAIREAAAAAGVPIHPDPPTARALHALVEIGEEVPPDLYRAVAAAIRFAEAMRARARAGWT
ncbi:flagellar type III secretion system protein FlhB (plasmid) [Paroceanicella profunda]|uniref:Flagellar type III secretion system protein FlhB n=1 Tax=Paroceanicella profunda TaxID=2579971 RepID=A0A5B8G5W9_9RHOB|nr:EscU/YscU/HrcU family type III secretion system export apparatus switch protein [Paroceanicella profunda]QDL94782.1 flagellar type III secretion system protein FlhB [Paroceanicella profunda]